MDVAVVDGLDGFEEGPVEVGGAEGVGAEDGVEGAAGEAGAVADDEGKGCRSSGDGDAAFQGLGGEEPAGDGGEAAGYGGGNDGGAVLAPPEDGAVLCREVLVEC